MKYHSLNEISSKMKDKDVKLAVHEKKLVKVLYFDLKAFPVHNAWSTFIVLHLRYPHLLERR